MNYMKITRKSILTGIERTLEVPVTEEQLAKYESGMVLAQVAFPDLTPDQREFIMTGVTPEEWDEAFGDDENDN